jgi:putative ABC transport system permease protein
MLGALGYLLGICAFAIQVVRTIWERRANYAIMHASGFTVARLRWLIILEYSTIIIISVAIGVFASCVSILPNRDIEGRFPWSSIGIFVLVIVLVSAVMTLLATQSLTKNRLIKELRSE